MDGLPLQHRLRYLDQLTDRPRTIRKGDRLFVMPADPSLIRDLADALKQTANDIEANWKKRSGGGPHASPPCDEEDLYEGD